VEGEDVRVGEAGRDLDLLQESLGSDERRETRDEHLDGHPALVLAVVGQVHGRHAAAAEHAAELVALGESGREVGRDVGCHGAGI
jgi:hypothetical protein